MAVATKNPPEVASSGLLGRMPVVSLLGAVYAMGCLGIIFSVLPRVWRLFFDQSSFVSMTLLGLVMLSSAVGLIIAGGRVLTPRTLPGVRAGIFVCLLGFVTILLLTRWVSLWVEYAVYDARVITPMVGTIITAVVGLALLFGGIRLLLKPRTESFLVRVEHQGWFSAKSFKPLQGLRVRRGTIFGILIIAGAGIYTLLTHGTLQRGPRDWQINVPFTEQITVENPGDATPLLKEKYPDWNETDPLTVDRMTLGEINAKRDPATYVKVTVADPLVEESWHAGDIVPRADYDAVVKKAQDDTTLKAVPTQPATGTTSAATLTLLPALPFGRTVGSGVVTKILA